MLGFRKRPREWVEQVYGRWPTYSLNLKQKAFVELFLVVKDKNVAGGREVETAGMVRFVSEEEFDTQCANPPEIPWVDVTGNSFTVDT